MGVVKVYDGIIGRQLRKAAQDTGVTQAEILGCLVAFWMWAIDNADEDGIIQGAGTKDVLRRISEVDDDKAIAITDALIQNEFIKIEGDAILIANWREHQKWKYKEDRTREADKIRKRKERKLEIDAALHPETKPTKKPEKKLYGGFVYLTDDEYEKLCNRWGEPLVQKGIDILDIYVGSTGRKYASHYMTMLGWPMQEACKNNPSLYREFKEKKNRPENPFAEYYEG